MGSTRPWKPWDNVLIGAGDVTDPVPCDGFEDKSIYFLTDTDGDIDIQVDPDGEGTWIDLHSAAAIGVRDEDDPWLHRTEYDFIYLRVKFSAAATVTCWVVLGA